MHLARGPVLFAVFAFAAGLLAGACSASATVVPSVAVVTASPPTVSPVPSQTATGSGGSPGSSATGSVFAIAGLAAAVVSGSQTIDTTAFATSFPADTQTIYAEVSLAPGLSGQVGVNWVSADGKTSSSSIAYPSGGPWVWFGLDVAGHLASGSDTVSLTFAPTGDVITLPFTITNGPAGSTPGASSGSAFEAIQLATVIVPGPPATPDPSSFTSAYSPSSPAFVVDFELAPDASGTITFTATFNGQSIVDPISHDFGAGWHSFKLDAAGAWPTGVYQATLTYAPTGETRNLEISVTADGGAASGTGTNAFTLLRLSTSTDTSGPDPDPSNFTDSYSTSSPAFNVNFKLADGLTGTVTCTFTKDGQAITSSPISIDYSANVGWGNFELDSPGTWKTGDFLATLTYVPTGESVTITIPVN